MSRKRTRAGSTASSRSSSATLDLPTVPKGRVDPSFRFQCLGILQSEVGCPLTGSAASARNIEFHVHRASHQDPHLYRRKLKTILTILGKHPGILENKTIEDIIATSEEIENPQSGTVAVEERLSSKLPTDFKPSCLTEGEDLAKCKACGSTNITITQRQTRSADEGMTEFYECQCGKRWKG